MKDQMQEACEMVCICGSMRFYDEMMHQAQLATLEGYVVVMPHINVSSYDMPKSKLDELKSKLDKLHLKKIDLSSSVLVVNVGGYIGESTRKEIDYARSLGKRVGYLVPVAGIHYDPDDGLCQDDYEYFNRTGQYSKSRSFS